jgi:hypothetical protein
MPLEGFLEKSGRYTKSWVKRFLIFDATTCQLSYGETQSKMKKGMTLSKIVRSSEQSPKIVAGSPDLFSFSVEGKTQDGKADMYAIRCPDVTSFTEWFFTIRNALGALGAMDPFNYGLPDIDPRTNLKLVHVPVEHLYRFHLLDRAILYLFEEVSVHSSTGGTDSTKELLIIGDRYVYLFHFTAEVHRCIPIAHITGVFAGTGCVGLRVKEPQHDVLVVESINASVIADVLASVLAAIPNTENLTIDTSIANVEGIKEHLHLQQREAYSLKVMAPTPKMKLKAAMDVYEKQTGQTFIYGSATKPAAKIDKKAVHQSSEAQAEMDMEDPMAALLMRLKLTQYVVMLQRQHVDIDLIACMDAPDLANFGIDDPHHRAMISAAAKGEPIPTEGGAPAATGSPAAAPAPKPAAPRGPITLSDSDDDLPPPKPVAPRPTITLSSDDDDDDLPAIIPVKKAIVLSDSDDDLPGPVGMNAPTATSNTAASPVAASRVVAVADDDI